MPGFGGAADPRGEATERSGGVRGGSLDRRVTAAVQRARHDPPGQGEESALARRDLPDLVVEGGRFQATNHCGTLVYEHAVTRAMALEGWCDDGWFHLVEGGRKFVLEGAPVRPEVPCGPCPAWRPWKTT